MTIVILCRIMFWEVYMKNKKIAYYNNDAALAFSDVYLIPLYSDIKSRFGDQIDTTTSVALGAPKLKIPFISAGMDTVTEDAMAEIMALNGGIGEIHRNNTPEEQAELVRMVKEKMRLMEKNPPMVSESATIGDALSVLEKRNRGYVIVYPGNSFKGKFSGMATNKDFLAGNSDTPIKDVMTPFEGGNKRKLITGDESTTLAKAVEIMESSRVEKLPIIDENRNLLGVYTLKDSQHLKKYPNAATDTQGRLMAGAAIGVREIDVQRALKLVDAGVDVLFLDIAHGHSVHTKAMVKRLKLREKIKTPMIIGNFATSEGVLFAEDIGADGIKVGIGPGFSCKTRNVAGTGVPQVTAILEAKNALLRKRNAPPLIADGGLREPGDAPKAIACGADAIMTGHLLVATDKSPGELIKIGGILQKRYSGMASKRVFQERKRLGDSTTNPNLYTPEGREVFIPYQGSTQDFLNEYIGGFRSAMSYAGAHSISEMQNARLIHVSGYGSNEQARPLSS